MSILADYLETRARKISGAHPSASSALDWKGLPVSTSTAGVDVDGETALAHTPIFAAINLLATTIASLPIRVYERTPAGGRREARSHPLWWILNREPNGEMSGPRFWTAYNFNRLARGNGVAEVERNGLGQAVALHVIPTSRVEPERTPRGRLRYRVTSRTGREQYLSADRAFVTPDAVSFSGLWARSRVEVAAEAVGVALARQTYEAQTYANGAMPAVAIRRPTEAVFMSKQAHDNRLRQFEESFRGPSRAGRTVILQEGEEIERLAFSPEEAEMIAAANFSVSDAARIFGVPLHMLAQLDRATHSNAETQSLEFVKYSLIPHLAFLRAEIERSILRDDRFFVDFGVEGLLRADSEGRGELYTALWQVGALTANEIRKLENLPAIEGGDRTYVPLNFAPSDAPAPMTGADPADTVPEDDIRAAFDGLLREELGRAVVAERRGVAKAVPDLDAPGSAMALRDFYEKHREMVERVVSPVLAAYARAGGETIDPAWYADAHVEERLQEALAALRRGVPPAEALSDIEEALP